MGDKHDPPPHDDDAREPLGPFTPDDETPLGDSPELHDTLSPHDLPKDHPGRQEAERLAAEEGGTTRGNVDGPRIGERLREAEDKIANAIRRDD